MNFICSTRKQVNVWGLIEHKIGSNHIYLDKDWIQKDNYFFKGISSSWCKIYFGDFIRIETNKFRDFPIYYGHDVVTNFKKLECIVPVDGVVELDVTVKISYTGDFYPSIGTEEKTFDECHDTLFNALIENVRKFSKNNDKKVYMPKQGGIDSLTARSVFDYLGVPYEIFDLPSVKPTLSALGMELAKEHWGFQQISPHENCAVVTGFYGDEWILRNPYYVHVLLSKKGVNIIGEFDKIESCYMKKYFEHYRKKCSGDPVSGIETLVTQICNDFQIWHLDDVYFFSPLKHKSLLNLLNADTQTILDQVTDAKLSKSIIKRCNPKMLDLIDPLKNQYDPDWFPPNS